MQSKGNSIEELILQVKRRSFELNASLQQRISNVITEIPKELSLIQNQHELVCEELRLQKQELDNRISLVDESELIMNILNFKQFEIRYIFREKMDGLAAEKQKLNDNVETKNQAEIATALSELDDKIEEAEASYESTFKLIKEQKLDIQKEYETSVNIMDGQLNRIRKNLETLKLLLEAEMEHSTPSQIQLLDKTVSPMLENWEKDILHYETLQRTGWKTILPEEKVSGLLEEHGLKVTKSGFLFTRSGMKISFLQAKEDGLLDSINVSWESWEQLLAEAGIPCSGTRPLQSSSTSSTTDSKMSSRDVSYLKDSVGQVLALGLAEVTSVQPRDPIHYLAHWLFRYRYNEQVSAELSAELQALAEERERIAKEKWHEFLEKEAREAVLQMILKAEEAAMLQELKRIEQELLELEEEDEEDAYNLEEEARDVLGTYDGPKTNPPL